LAAGIFTEVDSFQEVLASQQVKIYSADCMLEQYINNVTRRLFATPKFLLFWSPSLHQ